MGLTVLCWKWFSQTWIQKYSLVIETGIVEQNPSIWVEDSWYGNSLLVNLLQLLSCSLARPASKLSKEGGEIKKFLTIFAEQVFIHSALLHKGRVLWHSWEGDLLTLAAKDSETRSARVSSWPHENNHTLHRCIPDSVNPWSGNETVSRTNFQWLVAARFRQGVTSLSCRTLCSVGYSKLLLQATCIHVLHVLKIGTNFV